MSTSFRIELHLTCDNPRCPGDEPHSCKAAEWLMNQADFPGKRRVTRRMMLTRGRKAGWVIADDGMTLCPACAPAPSRLPAKKS